LHASLGGRGAAPDVAEFLSIAVLSSDANKVVWNITPALPLVARKVLRTRPCNIG
jgi:hypothetical protein